MMMLRGDCDVDDAGGPPTPLSSSPLSSHLLSSGLLWSVRGVVDLVK